MTRPFVRRRDFAFLLYEFLEVEKLAERPRFREHGRDTFEAVLDTAEAVARDRFLPHYAAADRSPPRFEGGRVHLPAEVKPAVEAFYAAGFGVAHEDEALGGMQLPWCVTQACFALFQSANISTSAYPFLAIAAANLLKAHGSQEQVGLYLQPMLEGRFLGTMALSEPQAGSSLADIRTRAEPQPEGHYHIVGSKMWISGAEHELSQNIVNMVLARIPGAPPGVKGISLFIVPKYLVEADGRLGRRNGVRLAGLNHKMGYRGTVNTVLSFGDEAPCAGWLLGEPNQGLAAMFHMMNEARIGVGLGAAALGYAGYLAALEYARTRPQGRHPGAKNPAAPQVPIVEHADVRHMLLAQKAYAEGGLALCLYAAKLVDEQRSAASPEAGAAAGQLLDVLTPIVKAWPSEWCLEANKWAIQVLGGYGYTEDFPVEQMYRDNRLNMIHEGTNGIQALDLLGRKVGQAGGAGFAALCGRIETTAAEARALPELAEDGRRLTDGLAVLRRVTATLLRAQAERGPAQALANAHAYLQLAGAVTVAWLWLAQALVARRNGAGAAGEEAAFYAGKLAACRYFLRWDLARWLSQAEPLETLDDTASALAPETL